MAKKKETGKGRGGPKPPKNYEDTKPVLMAYLKRVRAVLKNFRTAIVKQEIGQYYSEIAMIRIEPDGTIHCDKEEYLPDEKEVAAIKKEFVGVEFPRSIPIKSIDTAPDILRSTDPDKLFIFHDDHNNIVFVQKRWVDDKGERHYIPWSYWSDKQWRAMEPDGKLPIWGIEQLRHHTTLFLHEGAKAARYCRWMVESKTPEAAAALAAHPWGQELRHAAHCGWVGGALAPLRTDWSVLKKQKVSQIVLVCDNDLEGKEASKEIAKACPIAISAIKFDNQFPGAFDLADPFPEEMFQEIDGEKVYRGPSMDDCKSCATWATEAIPNPAGEGRPIYAIRREFLDQWHYSVSPPVFVHRDNPHRTLSEAEFNIAVAPFSHVRDTAAILRRHPSAEADGICYEPGMPSGVVSFGGSSKINTHVPSSIEPKAGDTKPWLDFLEHLIPNEKDRAALERWCATVIARPDRRVPYGVLLISETQGVGKTTLAEKILAPLVGWNNVSVPSEREVVESTFNTWIARKRLVCIHEIYAGQSKKAYNDIKSYVTERVVRVNEKFQPTYEVANWAAFLAASNSRRALHMADDDRRWFVPGVTEKKAKQAYWETFNKWLGGWGLNIIMQWAIDYCEDRKRGPIPAGEPAPFSEAKAELIEEGKSDGQRLVRALGELVMSQTKELKGDLGHDMILVDNDVRRWLAEQLGVDESHQTLERLSTIRSELKAAGMTLVPGRYRINMQYRQCLCNFPIPRGELGANFINENKADPWKLMPVAILGSGVEQEASRKK